MYNYSYQKHMAPTNYTIKKTTIHKDQQKNYTSAKFLTPYIFTYAYKIQLLQDLRLLSATESQSASTTVQKDH